MVDYAVDILAMMEVYHTIRGCKNDMILQAADYREGIRRKFCANWSSLACCSIDCENGERHPGAVSDAKDFVRVHELDIVHFSIWTDSDHRPINMIVRMGHINQACTGAIGIALVDAAFGHGCAGVVTEPKYSI